MIRFKKLNKIITTFIIAFIFSFCFSVAKAQTNYLYLGGEVLGFTIKTEGATVVGFTDVITDKGLISPCKNAGIEVGDIIYNMGENKVNSASDVALALSKYNGGEIITKISHNGQIRLVDLYPVKDLNGEYKLGVYLRDDLSGLGTVTFYRDDGSFASLGHPVSDEEGKSYSVIGGNVFNCSIVGVNKASRGKAGELKGMFLGDSAIGKINKNTNVGLYGKIDNLSLKNKIKIEWARAKQGKAKIYSTVDGISPKYYDIDIVKTDYFSTSNKNLVIKISDKDLINYTGGILQGMSGSPIIQDGKLVGAVTHVFVNDSSRGYGISIDNMLN